MLMHQVTQENVRLCISGGMTGDLGECAYMCYHLHLPFCFHQNKVTNANGLAADTAAGLEVSVDELPVGTIIQVKPGEKVPLDGVILSGSSRVDQSMLTGESVPVKRKAGDEVGRPVPLMNKFESSGVNVFLREMMMSSPVSFVSLYYVPAALKLAWDVNVQTWMMLQVLGGTVNSGTGCLEIKTSALAGDSAVARMAALVDMVSYQKRGTIRIRTA